jgi:hypothetical protein
VNSVHPFPLFFAGLFVVLMWTIVRSNANLHQLFDAFNSLSKDCWGFLLIIVGCIMYSTGLSAGEKDHGLPMLILGWGGKMLTGELQSAIQTTVTKPAPEPTPATPLPEPKPEVKT